MKLVNALFLQKAKQGKMLSTLPMHSKENEERVLTTRVIGVLLFKPSQPFETKVEFFVTLQMRDVCQVWTVSPA